MRFDKVTDWTVGSRCFFVFLPAALCSLLPWSLLNYCIFLYPPSTRACLCLHISVSLSFFFFLICLCFVSLFSVDTHTKLSISAVSRQGELHFLLYCQKNKTLLAVSFTHTGPLLKMPWWEKALWLKKQPSSFCHSRKIYRGHPRQKFPWLREKITNFSWYLCMNCRSCINQSHPRTLHSFFSAQL